MERTRKYYGEEKYHLAFRIFYEHQNHKLFNTSDMVYLGFMYDSGQGVPQDYKKAVEWYKKSANQGNTTALHNLELNYYKGQGTKKDYIKAMEYFNQASDLDLAISRYAWDNV